MEGYYCHTPPNPDSCYICKRAVHDVKFREAILKVPKVGTKNTQSVKIEKQNNIRLGDLLESALSSVGITQEAVKKWLGDCGCQERKDKLNELSDWVAKIFSTPLSKEEVQNQLNNLLKEK